jgi:FAD-dependent oxidoreductase family protein
MEPVFMATSHSAATAAAIAIDDACSIQDIDQAKLNKRLKDANQVLEWTTAK